jgi:hypothetical protein
LFNNFTPFHQYVVCFVYHIANREFLMMKKSFLFASRAAALSTLAVALTASALQTVVPVKDATGTAYTGSGTVWSGSAGLGTVVTVIGRYSTDNPTANESGLGLKVIYDEAKFTGVTVTPLITNCMIAPPQIQAGGAATKAVLGWIDTAVRNPAGFVGWPYLADPAVSTVIPVTSPCLNPNTPANGTGTNGPGAVNLFQFQGTLAPALGVGGTATVQFVSEGNFSYATTTTPGMADQTLTITAAAAPTIALASASTVRTHNDGTTSITVPVPHTAIGTAAAGVAAAAAGAGITVEPRGGSAHTVAMTFNSAPTSGTASVVSCIVPDPVNPAPAFLPCAANPTVGAVVFDAATLTANIALAGVTNQSRVLVRLSGVNGTALDADVAIGFLRGDTNGNGIIQGGDVNFAQLRLGLSPTNTANFNTSAYKADNDANGVVQGGDVNAIQLRLGTRLP